MYSYLLQHEKDTMERQPLTEKTRTVKYQNRAALPFENEILILRDVHLSLDWEADRFDSIARRSRCNLTAYSLHQ